MRGRFVDADRKAASKETKGLTTSFEFSNKYCNRNDLLKSRKKSEALEALVEHRQ